MPTKDLTHSNGSIVQGGFVSGMLDASMSQYLIFIFEGKKVPLTLDLDIKFIKSCSPDKKVFAVSKIIKKGNSIAFTSGELLQNNSIIATASSTSKLVSI
jgi:acyl-coenzyme A thioesterase PaaI-like protein